jgi:hypothetical protein
MAIGGVCRHRAERPSKGVFKRLVLGRSHFSSIVLLYNIVTAIRGSEPDVIA